MKKLRLLWILFMAGMGTVKAHSLPSGKARLSIVSNSVVMHFSAPLEIMELASKSEIDTRSVSSVALFKNYIVQHFHITDPLQSNWDVQVDSVHARTDDDPAIGRYRAVAAVIVLTPSDVNSRLEFNIHSDIIIHQIPNQSVLFTQDEDSTTEAAPLEGKMIGAINLDLPTGKILPLHVRFSSNGDREGIKSMILLGMNHIREGTDHLLFLFVLLLPSMLLVKEKRWSGFGGLRYGLSGLFKIVTAFTIGHSVTLLLGASGLLQVPSRPVEILIAVSIIFSAVHALYPVFSGKELFVAAGFGLVHGAAFATVLSVQNLNTAALLRSIVGFNLGIELMQLCIIVLVIPWLMMLSKTPVYFYFRISGAAISLLASLGWIAVRVTGKTNFIAAGIEVLAGYAAWGIVLLALLAVLSSIFCHYKKSEKSLLIQMH